jgi:Predicted nucleotide-binding protein containing TIR-like domain
MIRLMPFHVRVTHKNRQRRSNDTVVLDKDETWIAEQIVTPRSRGRAMFIGGQVIEWDDVDEIHVTYSERSSTQILPEIRARRAREAVVVAIPEDWYVAYEAADVTERFLSGPQGSEPQERVPVAAEDTAAVMVVHGQDVDAATALFDWLRAIGLRPREWGQLVTHTGSGSPFIGDVLDQAFREVQAVVALFTPDERVAVREELTGRASHWRLQARPNVLFEAGMAFATHPDRTVLVVLGDQELPSDLAGRHFVRLGDARALRELARRLENAGCPVDITGDQWLDETRFPDRTGVAAAPRLVDASRDEARDVAYATLLATHDALLLAYSGQQIAESRIRQARTAFDEAQTNVLVRGDAAAREAAEALRVAWAPREHGLYMGTGTGWRSDVETARQTFVQAIHGHS